MAGTQSKPSKIEKAEFMSTKILIRKISTVAGFLKDGTFNTASEDTKGKHIVSPMEVFKRSAVARPPRRLSFVTVAWLRIS
jgi:hypothetical protein